MICITFGILIFLDERKRSYCDSIGKGDSRVSVDSIRPQSKRLVSRLSCFRYTSTLSGQYLIDRCSFKFPAPPIGPRRSQMTDEIVTEVIAHVLYNFSMGANTSKGQKNPKLFFYLIKLSFNIEKI